MSLIKATLKCPCAKGFEALTDIQDYTLSLQKGVSYFKNCSRELQRWQAQLVFKTHGISDLPTARLRGRIKKFN